LNGGTGVRQEVKKTMLFGMSAASFSGFGATLNYILYLIFFRYELNGKVESVESSLIWNGEKPSASRVGAVQQY
jgi:hypothetical protein